jgi:hypothetical protein
LWVRLHPSCYSFFGLVCAFVFSVIIDIIYKLFFIHLFYLIYKYMVYNSVSKVSCKNLP